MIVLDAGAAVRLLLRYESGWEWVAEQVGSAGSLHAPHLIDFEYTSVLRRYVLRGEISAKRATQALGRLVALSLTRYPAERLLGRMWELRANLTAYDAAYVALAEALDAPLVTTDRRLATATGHTAEILTPAR